MENAFQIACWLVQPSQNTVSNDGMIERLEPKVMEVLLCLAEHAGETVSKEQFIQTVWRGTFVTDDVLTRSISELRRVFGDDPKESRIIQTIPKRGYRLVAPVVPLKSKPAANAQVASTEGAATAVSHTAGRKLHYHLPATFGILLLIGLLAASRSGWIRDRLGLAKRPSIQSLAVLPLQNLSGDPTQEYFADGMTDGLISELSQIGSVRVISRTSITRYKKTNKTLPEIARELNVDGIIEGTVQRSGDRVRITAQLLHASTENHLWADVYERDLKDVFALERELTQEIARQIQVRVVPQTSSPATLPQKLNVNALEAYLQGTNHLDRVGQGFADEENRKAGEYFQQAIEADPSFVQAYVGLLRAHDGLLLPSREDAATIEKARKKVIELAPHSSIAAMLLAEAKVDDWDWTGAEQEYRKAITIDPNNVKAHRDFARLLDDLARFDDGWSEQMTAQALDPNPDRLPGALELPTALATRGKCADVIPLVLRILDTNPNDGQSHLQLSDCYGHTGRYQERIQELGRVCALYGYSKIETRLNHAYDTRGYLAAMRQWTRELEHLQAAKEIYLPAYLASVYGELGDKEKAFYWLEEAYKYHLSRGLGTDLIHWLKADPNLQLIRSDARYFDLLRRVGLPPDPGALPKIRTPA